MQDTTSRITDPNGFIEIKNNPLTRAGVYEYLGSEIGAPEPNKRYNVYRPEDELSDPAFIDSLRGKPLVNDHTMIGDGNTPAEKKGVDGVIGDNVYYQDGGLFGNLHLFTDRIRKLIGQGKKELSLGYYARYEKTPGTWQGQAYDYIQRLSHSNHIALVDDGRCGDLVSVLDSIPILSIDLPQNPTKETPMATTEEVTKIVTDALAPVLTAMDAMSKRLAAMDEESEKEDKDEKEVKDEDADEDEKETKDESSDENEKDEKKEAMDASAIEALVKRAVQDSNTALLADLKAKNELVELSFPLVGTFDHSAMLAADVAKYTATKLGLDGDPITAVKTYAKAMQSGGKAAVPVTDAKATATQLKAGEFN